LLKLPLIVERVNRELDGVVDVEVLFTGGDIHQRVGEHSVQCSVTRLITAASVDISQEDQLVGGETIIKEKKFEISRGKDHYGRDVVTQCFLVPFTILDVNECLLPLGNSLRHACQRPSYCVNTVGSYECICPLDGSHTNTDGIIVDLVKENAQVNGIDFWNNIEAEERSPWELSIASLSKSTCPGKVSTYGCCEEEAHEADGRQCRADFRCSIDPCVDDTLNDCAAIATCQRASSPLERPTNICLCPEGLMGNGRKCRKGIDPPPKPMVKYDGVTPSDETIQNDYYCGCTKPVIDPCAGFPKCEGKNEICTVGDDRIPFCACKHGHVKVKKFGCVDEQPPILKLRNDPKGDKINRLRQGDTYREYAVDVIDENAEDYLRSLKITYSRPLPPACLENIGSFHVNYTVATPWTSPPYVSVTRNVVIEDINECEIDDEKYGSQCPKLIPSCDVGAGAVCQNTDGSYTCKCPRFTSGDGFKFMSSIQRDKTGNYVDAPVGYKGGSGCRDTSKPIIEILGPNPKIFRTCQCGGLIGVMKKVKRKKGHVGHDGGLIAEQRNGYEDDIKQMIKDTAGAELCASHTLKNPGLADCVRATDHTYEGIVDLTSQVKVGEPVQDSPFEWKIPYNVVDEAGNSAKTVWRTVIVEEVNLIDAESQIREEIVAENKKALSDALEREKQLKELLRKERALQASKNIDDNGARQMKTEKEIREDLMKELSQMKTETCSISFTKEEEDAPSWSRIVHFVSGIFSVDSLFTIAGCTLAAIFFIILRIIVRSMISSRGEWYYLTPEDEKKEKEMLDAVTYYRSPEHRTRMENGTNQPPSSSMMSAQTGFNNASDRRNGGHVGSSLFSPPGNRVYGESRQKLFSGTNGEDTSIYQTMTPITPLRSINSHTPRSANG